MSGRPRFDLSGRVMLVTGSGAGVGRVIAMSAAAAGATVVVNDVRAEAAESVVGEIIAAGHTACAASFDVGDTDGVAAAIDTASKSVGPIDILVNNAGVPVEGLHFGPFVESDPTEWWSMLRVNVMGVMNCTRAVLPSMTEDRWGRVITVTSDAGRFGEPLVAAYAASKAGGAAFTRSVAKEVGRFGITANCVSLGAISVAQTTGLADDDEARARRLKRYAIKRFGEPDDVAGAVLWLSSDSAEWITGQTISINGGYVTAP